MDAPSETVQRIVRLTPLGAVLAIVAAEVEPVAPQDVALAAGLGRTLAADVVAAAAVPARPLALRDGWAVPAELTADAGSYAPAPLPASCVRIDVGEPLPDGCDAVAPLDAVVSSDGQTEALTPVAPGDGILPAGGDAAVGTLLRPAGARLRHADMAALAVCGVERVRIRAPRIRLCRGGAPSAIVDATSRLIAGALTAEGARGGDNAASPSLDSALYHADADAIVTIGGTGSGRHDRAVRYLRDVGRVAVHGIAMAPGETAAFGFANGKPVLLLPARIDAALAVWLVLGRPLLRRLAGGTEAEPAQEVTLGRKVTSTLGLTEVIPVRQRGEQAEPLASGYLAAAALLQADGWIVVPPDSEGFPQGTRVTVWPWP
jgi:molybdopterin molybdotransferase